MPFKNHWYVGLLPPFEGLAVNVTVCPEHVVMLEDGEIMTAGTTVGFIVIVVVEDVAIEGFAQLAFEVILQ